MNEICLTLDILRNAGGHEIGIHPNFNALLPGEQSAGKQSGEMHETIVDRCLLFVPEAKCNRSHSLTQNSQLLSMFFRKGLTHEVSTFIPYDIYPNQEPWLQSGNLTRVPFGWEDAPSFSGAVGIMPEELLDVSPLCGLCYHPIHVFMNTNSPKFYEEFKPNYHNAVALQKRRRPNSAPGAKRKMVDFLDHAKGGYQTNSLVSSLSLRKPNGRV